MQTYKINDTLALVQQPVSKNAPVAAPIEVPTDHVAIIDCSGSMYSDLPKVRAQLKRQLPKLLKEKDTVSIIWFSGRGQFGTLLEAEPVATLTDLKAVETAIDRWLQPQGLTGFKEPLEEVSKLADRLAKKTSNVINLLFMSDGCDNCWPRGDILKAVETASGKVASATFIEYGYYADRNLLSQMAEKSGGSLIFAEDFDRYVPMFDAVIQKRQTGAKKIEVAVTGDPVGGFAYAFQGGDLLTFAIEGGTKVSVPEDLKEIFYLIPSTLKDIPGVVNPAKYTPALYAALSLYSQRMNSDVVFALLKATGDVTFINSFTNCFGKQRYSEFMDATKMAAFDESKRLTNGFNPNLVPKEDAFTVLDLLRVLSSDDENRILLDSKDFKYSRIGRGRVDSSEVLTAEEQQQIADLSAEMAKTKDAKKIKEITAKIAAVTANKPEALKFEADKNEDGYPISSLTYNEDRPNISFMVRKTGKVDLTMRLKKDQGVPATFETFIFRNYAVIKDGLVNLEKLPVRLSAGTIRQLREAGMPIETILGVDGESDEQARVRAAKAPNDRLVSLVFDLKSLPIINRQMVKAVSAERLFKLEYELTKARADQKVFNTYKKDKFPRKSEGFIEKYGKEAADWLKEQGLTDYSGFSPKVVQAESTDVYMGKELVVSLKGLSSLPSLKEARDKIAKGKTTASVALMQPAIDKVEAFLATKPSDSDLETWLDAQAKDATGRVRGMLYEMAQIKFSITVGQTWPSEFKSLDENSLVIEVNGTKVEATLNMKEVEIRI